MQTLKMLTAAITFATFGIAGTAIANTSGNTQSTGQGSASESSTNVGGDENSSVKRSEAITPEDPEYARDTHTSAYKKTYPDEKPVMGEELSPDQQNELTPSDKDWEEDDQKQ